MVVWQLALAEEKRTFVRTKRLPGYDSYEVIPDTVSQFAGLFDKNGKEIYEGDILLIGVKEGARIYNKVGIKDGCFGYVGENTGELMPFCDYDVTEKIVGNIYDSPKLIEIK